MAEIFIDSLTLENFGPYYGEHTFIFGTLEANMDAHFAFVDASQSGDKFKIEQAAEAMKRWQKYGG